MSKTNLIILLTTAMFCCVAYTFDSPNQERLKIEALILESYVHGAFNELNPEAMKKGFHPDFAIFSPDGNNLGKYPIADWVERTRLTKENSDFDPAENQWKHEFVQIDITGASATVKLKLSKEGRLVFTDYLSLLKFEDGWRIVAKVYHRHSQ